MQNFGKSAELFALGQRVSDQLWKLPPEPLPPIGPNLKFPQGLLGGSIWEPPPIPMEEARQIWADGVREKFKVMIDSEPLAKRIHRNSDYRDLESTLEWHKARRRGPLADARAPHWLFVSAVFGLAHLALTREGRIKIDPPAKDDWLAGVQAVRVLASLQRRGADLLAPITQNPSARLDFDWLDRLEAALLAAARGRKRHVDKHTNEREAIKHFANYLFLYIKTLPPSLVVKFGEFIGHAPATLKTTHIPLWLEQFQTHSVA